MIQRKSARLQQIITEDFIQKYNKLKESCTTGYIYLDARFLNHEKKQQFVFTHLPQNTQILRMSTFVPIKKETMKILVHVIYSIGIWGINMGETECTMEAWEVLLEGLRHPKCLVGFMWINEIGKLQYITKNQHRKLQCNFKEQLRVNRKKTNHQEQPWYDSHNAIMKEPIATKFWFNPKMSKYYK